MYLRSMCKFIHILVDESYNHKFFDHWVIFPGIHYVSVKVTFIECL